MLKPALKYILTRYIRGRYLNSRIPIIKNKIAFLKKKGLYKKFPYDELKPTVFNYNFNNKYSKYYIDFFYSVNGELNPGYIPISLYLLHIEPVLNDLKQTASIQDKNYYDLNLSGIKTPHTLIRKIHSSFYDFNYNKIELNDTRLKEILSDTSKLILKPSIESGSGKGILLFDNKNTELIKSNNKLTISLLSKYPDFVLQEFIEQHEYYKKFNSTSNNTIRILTYRSVIDNKVHILQRLLRIGKAGSYLDHDNQGGVVAGISKSGQLNHFCIDSNGIRYPTYNGIEFKNQSIAPCMPEIESTAVNISEQIFYARLLAIDFTVNNNGEVLLLEINCHTNGISQYQMNNGPVFNLFTEEILDYTFENMKSLSIELKA